MEIKTKFDIGDRVWAIDWAFGKWFVDDIFTIIQIVVDKTDDKIQCYYVEYCESWHSVENCFATREEAQEKCDELNFENEFAKELENVVDKNL